MKKLLLLCFVAGTVVSHAWFDTGHMVVAAIAENKLTPRARALANELVKIDTVEKNNTFITASCWADDNKSATDRTWHYNDIYFRADGKPTDKKADEENAVWAINKWTAELANENNPKERRALALRYLLHIVGDIHQPLHSMARETDKSPNGDRGGNDFTIPPMPGWQRPPKNLHFLWDAGGGEFELGIQRPLNSTDSAKLQRMVNGIQAQYPLAKLDSMKSTDPMDWCKESFSLRGVVYGTIEDQIPSEKYLARVREISRKRVARAGYRLAALLNKALK